MTTHGFDLLRYGQAMARMMSEWYSYTSEVLRQSSDLGSAREHFVHHILENILPKSVILGAGEIVDGAGNRSGQQDVIVYRADFPVITSLTPVNTYLVEGVIATIEVKSNLSTGSPNHLISAFRNARSALALRKQAAILSGTPEQVSLLQRASSLKSYIIGYSGWQTSEGLIQNHALGIQDTAGVVPHVVCQPGGCVVVSDGFLNPALGIEPNSVLLNRDNPYAVLLHHLLKAVMLNTSGSLVTAPGIEATMNYDLGRYFNFSPPLAFERFTIRTMAHN